jgi:tetratricopeptide (TPR) repeat protein
MQRTILGAVLVLAVATTAHADDKKKAKVLYDEGLKRYNLAEYPDAIKAWKEAYLLSKKPLLLFNIGQAYRLSGDCKQAMTFYDSYQREEPSPKNQDELDEALKLCKDAKPADSPADKPADKPVPAVTTTPTPPPVETKPTDKPTDKPALPTATKPTDKTVAQPERQPTDEVDEPAVTTTGGGLRKVGIGIGIAGVVLGGVGVYFALDSGKAASDLDGYTGAWGQEQIDLEARGERSAKLGWVFGISGAAAVVAGGVMFAIGGPKTVEANAVSLIPSHGGAQLSWAHRF